MALMTRTLTLRGFVSPTRRISRASIARRSFGWSSTRQLAHLVEEDRAAVGRLERADAVAVGAGEAAAQVAEELATRRGSG